MCASICKDVSDETGIPFSFIVAKTYLKGKVGISRKEAQRRAIARVHGVTRRDVADFFGVTPRRVRASVLAANEELYCLFFPSRTASATLREKNC